MPPCQNNRLKIYRYYFSPKMLAIFFWAFACGTPQLLISSTLSVRLLQTHLNLTKIGLFSFVLLPYSFKYFLAPIIEKTVPFFLSNFIGSARAWMIYMMLCISLGIYLLAIYPLTLHAVVIFFLIAFFIAFCSTINDIAEAEYRIELLEENEIAIGTAYYVIGYGLGEFIAGAGALIIAYHAGWKTAYTIMILPMIIGMITVLLKRQKVRIIRAREKRTVDNNTSDIVGILKKPLINLLQKIVPKWQVLLIFIYFGPSYMLLMIINPFYLHLHFSLSQIGVVKGLPTAIMMFCSCIVGAYICRKLSIIRGLYYAALLYMINIFLLIALYFIVTYANKYGLYLFYISVLVSAISDGFCSIPYLSYLSSHCSYPYTASQYACLTSIMALSRTVFSSTGGIIAQHWGYLGTFWAINVLLLIIIIMTRKLLNLQKLSQSVADTKLVGYN